MSEYACHAFHKDLKNGRSSGELHIDEMAAHFSIGDHTLRCGLSQLKIFMGGANNRLIFFSHPDYPEWSMYTNDRSILKDPILAAVPSLAAIQNKARRHHARGWALIAAIGIAIIAIPLFLLLRMDIVTGAIAPQVPVAWETSLGESVIAQYRVDTELMPEDEADQALEPLVDALYKALPDSRYTYDFYIANESQVNAFALPGGKIVIHSALILEADSAEELLGVIAHEMMHVEKQHGIRNVMGAAGIYLLVGALLGDVSGILTVVSGATPLLLNQSYSRRYEREADSAGFALLIDANINPQGLISFFHTLQEKELEQAQELAEHNEEIDEQTQEFIKQTMEYLSTHPATDSRIADLQKKISKYENENSFIDLSNEFITLQNSVRAFTDNSSQEKQENE